MRYVTSVEPGGAATDEYTLPQLHDLRRLYGEASGENTGDIAEFLEWIEEGEYAAGGD